MKKIFFSILLLMASYLLLAHPSIGIVKDSKGNIYYTDLKQVWKIDPLTQKKTIVVPGVHSHELFIDANDNLYGEHVWYNGEQLNTWGYYVWCLKSTGELMKEIEPTEGFLNDYSFVRDSSGNMYWVERFTVSRIMKKSPDGKITKLAEEKFGFIGWIYAAKNGTVYFTENNKLHKLTPDGKLVILTNNLMSKTTDFSIMGHNYTSYGIWTDATDNIYIAMIDSKKVNRVSPDGKIESVVKSNSLWTTCSGLFDNNGNMWLLENSVTNEVRVRKISPGELASGDAESKKFSDQPHLLVTLIAGIMIAILLIALNWILQKRKNSLQFNLL